MSETVIIVFMCRVPESKDSEAWTGGEHGGRGRGRAAGESAEQSEANLHSRLFGGLFTRRVGSQARAGNSARRQRAI